MRRTLRAWQGEGFKPDRSWSSHATFTVICAGSRFPVSHVAVRPDHWQIGARLASATITDVVRRARMAAENG